MNTLRPEVDPSPLCRREPSQGRPQQLLQQLPRHHLWTPGHLINRTAPDPASRQAPTYHPLLAYLRDLPTPGKPPLRQHPHRLQGYPHMLWEHPHLQWGHPHPWWGGLH